MTIKPLPGQPSLFEAAPTTADEAQAAAAARRGDEDDGRVPERWRCSWGTCEEIGGFHIDGDERPYCRLHVKWATLIKPRRGP